MRGRGRPFNRDTPLGQILWQRGYTLKQFEQATGIGQRMMCDYLAGRQSITAKHMAAICDELDLPREVILGQAAVESAHVRAHAGKLDPDALVSGMVGAMKGAQ